MRDKRLEMNDEQLINDFFTEARQPIADDGFTERVINALPTRAASFTLSRYSLWLNITAVVGIVISLIYLGFFTRMWEFLQELMARILVAALSYDYDGLLVQMMLLFHRMPELLPSTTQLAALALSTVILMTLAIERHFQQV